MNRSIAGSFETDLGALVPVRVYFSQIEVRRRRTNQEPMPEPLEVMALIDTGAECSCMDHSLLDRLPLPLYRAKFINAPDLGGINLDFSYDASLTVLHPSGDFKLNCVVKNLPILALKLNTVGYDLVLGRDVLSRCTFTYDGRKRSFTLEY